MTHRPGSPEDDERNQSIAGVRIVDAEIDGRRGDIEWRDGVVIAVRPPRSAQRRHVDVEVNAGGGAVIAGLHDHHIHLMALAAARASIDVGPRRTPDRGVFVRRLTAACRQQPGGGWVRAVGYHDAVAGPLDADVLDQLVPAGTAVPLRVQHRSGQLWILNRCAVAAARLGEIRHPGVERSDDDVPTGRVYGLDDELADRIPAAAVDLTGTFAQLARFGVTGVTDLTPTSRAGSLDVLAAAAVRSDNPLRVTVTGAVDLAPHAGRGLPRGPVKILPPDHAEIDYDQLCRTIRDAHRMGRNVAIHAVSRVGAALAVAAWNDAGVRSGDRLEHGAVLDPGLIDVLRELGLMVVTQPNFVAERGDEYAADVDPTDLPHLWRCGSLDAAGIPVVGGTDAPFGEPDPWRAITAAIERRTPSGAVLGDDERVAKARALALFTGTANAPLDRATIEVGTRVDLCLLDRPLADMLDAPTSAAVRGTVGRVGFREVEPSDNAGSTTIAEAGT